MDLSLFNHTYVMEEVERVVFPCGGGLKALTIPLKKLEKTIEEASIIHNCSFFVKTHTYPHELYATQLV